MRSPLLPGIRDWLLLFGCAAFIALTLFVWANGASPRFSVASLAFWGLGVGVAVWQLVEKYRFRAHVQATVLSIAAPPSVPIFISRLRYYLLGFGIAIVGAAFMVLAHEAPLLIRALGGGICVAGAILVLLLTFSHFGSQYIAFEPEGLRVGDCRWSFLLGWDNVAGFSIVSISGNSLVVFSLADPSLLLASLDCRPGDSSAWQRKLSRQVTRNRSHYGGDIDIMPFKYGMDLTYFVRAIERYTRDPAARAELEPRDAISEDRAPGPRASLGRPA